MRISCSTTRYQSYQDTVALFIPTCYTAIWMEYNHDICWNSCETATGSLWGGRLPSWYCLFSFVVHEHFVFSAASSWRNILQTEGNSLLTWKHFAYTQSQIYCDLSKSHWNRMFQHLWFLLQCPARTTWWFTQLFINNYSNSLFPLIYWTGQVPWIRILTWVVIWPESLR